MPLNQSPSNSHKRFNNFTNLGILCPKEIGIVIYNMSHHYKNTFRKILCNQEFTTVYWGIQWYAGGNQRPLGVLWGIPTPQKFENLSKGTTYQPKNIMAWVYGPLIGCTISANTVINPLRAKYFQREQTCINIYVIPPYLHDTGNWNPSSSKTRTYLFYIVNVICADALETQGARASATII